MTEERTVNVSYQLEGEDAKLFLEYKNDSFIKSTAEAARKLMLERLNEIRKQQKEFATVAR